MHRCHVRLRLNSASGNYEAHTDLVSVTAESDGMHFTIKNPANLAGSDEKYKKGCNWIGVYRLENIGGEEIQTTLAVVDKSPFSTGAESISFVYPLCEAGEQYKFKVQIEPAKGEGESLVRENGYCHQLVYYKEKDYSSNNRSHRRCYLLRQRCNCW